MKVDRSVSKRFRKMYELDDEQKMTLCFIIAFQ